MSNEPIELTDEELRAAHLAMAEVEMARGLALKRHIIYILEDQQPVPCTDAVDWAEWMETHRQERRVALDRVGDLNVSTVFLGNDAALFSPVPILFETMVFAPGGAAGDFQRRYATWDEAAAGHAEVVRGLRETGELP